MQLLQGVSAQLAVKRTLAANLRASLPDGFCRRAECRPATAPQAFMARGTAARLDGREWPTIGSHYGPIP